MSTITLPTQADIDEIVEPGVFVLTNDTLPEDGQQVGLNVLRLMNGYSWS